MTKITFPDGGVRGPAKLDMVQLSALLEWLPADERGLDSDLERYAHQRNVHRAAEAFGPSIVSLLMESGALEAENDPVECVRQLLKGAGF